jgi:hypothetical protein
VGNKDTAGAVGRSGVQVSTLFCLQNAGQPVMEIHYNSGKRSVSVRQNATGKLSNGFKLCANVTYPRKLKKVCVIVTHVGY